MMSVPDGCFARRFAPKAVVALMLAAVQSVAAGVEVRRTFRPERLTLGNTNVRPLQPIDGAAWIWAPDEPDWALDAADDWAADLKDVPAVFRRFRCDFSSDGTPFELDVSADERFVLLLDGEIIARGPHRGAVDRWHYATYEVGGLSAGPHRMEAVVWRLGIHAPIAQLSWRGGFVLKASGAHDAKLTTGKAPWRTVRLVNTRMTDRGTSATFGAGSQCEVTGTSFLDESPDTGWQAAAVVRRPLVANQYGGRVKGWRLFPSACPDQVNVRGTPGRVVNASCDLKRSWTVPPQTEVDLWWDLGNYYCAYPELRVSGGKGAVVTWGWSESLTDEKGRKGNRDEWKGKGFSRVLADTFRCDGRAGALFTSPWWRCGRWCRLTVRTADAPLAVDGVSLVETHYPIAFDATFASDDPLLDRIGAICRRSLEMCVHEMTVDCPYYEQQMYPGDSRVQLEILNALTRDDRMARYVMTTFDADRRSDGFVAMNFPTRGTQESATYTMCWILMLGDYLRWHDDAAFLKARMPGVRNALMGLALYENADGFLQGLPGWCFTDWVKGWKSPEGYGGTAPGSGPLDVSSVENLFYLRCLQTAAEVDAALGEAHLAAHWRTKAERLGAAIRARFWDAASGRLADTADRRSFSEHAQSLALLTGILSEDAAASAAKALADGRDLMPASTYFAHYIFDALMRAGRADEIRRRMDGWKAFLDQGAKTTFETQQPWTRSDCHAWSACPAYFFNTAFAGVTPAAPFFRKVRVAPQPSGLGFVRARTPSPRGLVETDFRFGDGGVTGVVTLPAGLTGEFVWKGRRRILEPGRNEIAIGKGID